MITNKISKVDIYQKYILLLQPSGDWWIGCNIKRKFKEGTVFVGVFSLEWF